MSDYTPTTEEVQFAWKFMRYQQGAENYGEIANAEFDRWLAEVIRKAKEEAWNEGWVSETFVWNPYRQGEGSGNSNSQPTAETPNYLNLDGEEQ